ncbi:peptidoglycan editing factor PgeF [Mangrovibacterium diazotrophicum]|uniref:Purine nucleoside phosphorylase n=1 Tax=Mangrovibacterium diazotrophicum TaxID=1261403 RepID=A0A419WAG5_9BACT|nr:peptidoglycan editing factor PgeF [Mangrovibacterium diazotrophicum]RKD92458.1 hypothetical protein BC643_2831 [Mangrovibacterium diazotrophicum]
MKKISSNQKYFYQFDRLSGDGILHFSSTKAGWGGDGRCRFTGDSAEVYADYRRELAESLGLKQVQFVFPRQTHSSHVVVVQKSREVQDVEDTDALVTNQPGLCICVQTADCVPVLIYDPVRKVVAAIHAGWRGTVGKIVEKTVATMKSVFQSDPSDLLAGIGPSISTLNYEIGEDVIFAVRENFANHQQLLVSSEKEGKAYFDLWKANQSVLLGAGLSALNIEVMNLCSYDEEHDFFSARRDGLLTGRMITGIMIV